MNHTNPATGPGISLSLSSYADFFFFMNVILEVSYLISILFYKAMHLSPAFKI